MSNLAADKQATASAMSVFERYLTVWVAACIVVGDLIALLY